LDAFDRGSSERTRGYEPIAGLTMKRHISDIQRFALFRFAYSDMIPS